MKKALSLLLCLAMVLSCCICASAASAEAAVQVTIAPYLYKSTQHQMEFPSHQSYAIKEKSTAGDYAISRELNDLSYVFLSSLISRSFPVCWVNWVCKKTK